ncbi:uncharacterized protein [Nicotiana tomentosiformis]|uniref:uncharacterized protein n=1 Tax=Nicotiana tomentosiformis TaxID=4098 RepID=UPI00388CB70F
MISLWENLKEVAQGINIPWLVTGDFNEVMAPQDRMFGNPVTYVETKDYANCIRGLMLNELQWKCDYYTWTNKQSGTDIIYSRIDRTFGNHEWMMQWEHLLVEYDIPLISDHSLMVLAMAHLKQNIKIPFRFFNIEKTRAELINTQKQISNKCSDELVEIERQQLHNLKKWSMIEEQAMQ